MQQTNIAKRLKAAREDAGLTQQQLSDALGFKDRQTVAAIEAGIRKISADELLKAMQILGKDLEYFTDPFRLDGEGNFSWRFDPDVKDHLDDFESRAGSWLALYKVLAPESAVMASGPGDAPGPNQATPGFKEPWPRTSPLSLALTPRSSYEDAHNAASWLSGEWQLGDVPADRLEGAIRERLRALVLYVDAPHGISGAAFRLPEFNAILINRKEPAGRRNFDLAHELFHLLTWETIRPAHTESGMLNAKGRPEQLANCFASSLLMPERVIRKWLDAFPSFPHKDREWWNNWLNDRAYDLRVSTPALQWRMVQLGLLSKGDVDNTLDWFAEREMVTPRPFSEEFVHALHSGLNAGRVSVRRAAALLGMTIDELADLFRAYQVDVPFDI
jgi:Zn-dependent peptidase ImmA (M78 family)/transcriptional regulator with XRE-family HTH domain